MSESDLGVSGIYAFDEECDLDGSMAVFTTGFVPANGPGYAEVIRLQLGPSLPISGWLGIASFLGAAMALGARLSPRRSHAAWRGR